MIGKTIELQLLLRSISASSKVVFGASLSRLVLAGSTSLALPPSVASLRPVTIESNGVQPFNEVYRS